MNNQANPVQAAPYLLPLQAAYGLNGFNPGGLVSLGSPHQLGAGVMGAGQLGKLATGLPQGAYPGSPHHPGLTAVSLAAGTNAMGQLHGLQVASAMGQLPAGVMSQLAAGQLPLGSLGPAQGSLYSPLMSPGGLSPYPGVPGSLPQVLGPNGMTNMGHKLFVPSVKVGDIMNIII